MIIKTFELDKLKSSKVNSFLLYGENEGFKSQIIEKYFINKFKKNVNKYDENEVLNNLDNFISNLTNKSFFEEAKLIVIYRATDKIFEIFNNVLEKNIAAGIVHCRLKYWRVPKKMPNTIEGMANYWKKYYNTEQGKGNPEHFIDACRKYLT